MADINRKTFYNYYDGIYQLVDEIENEIITTFDDTIGTLNLDDVVRDPHKIFKRLIEAMNSDLEFYGYLLRMDNNVTLAMKLIDLIKGKIKDSISASGQFDEKRLEIAVDYTVTGMVSVFRTWFVSDSTLSLEEVSEILSRVCVNGLADIIYNRPDNKKTN